MNSNQQNSLVPEPVVGLYIIYNDKIVMVKGPKWDGWRVPGGHIDYGEDLFETARREAKEELGLEVTPLGLLEVAQAIRPTDFINSNKHYIFFEILCEAKTENVNIDEREIKECKWVDLNEAETLFKSPISRIVVKNYLENKGHVRFIKMLR